jgi:hypothetical protein
MEWTRGRSLGVGSCMDGKGDAWVLMHDAWGREVKTR